MLILSRVTISALLTPVFLSIVVFAFAFAFIPTGAITSIEGDRLR